MSNEGLTGEAHRSADQGGGSGDPLWSPLPSIFGGKSLTVDWSPVEPVSLWIVVIF
jgi:hypothetical protein